MNITPVLASLVTLFVAMITTFLIPYIKIKVDSERLLQALQIAETAVRAAEQLFAESGMGTKKKEYVTNYLLEHGFVLDEQQIDILIESAVYDLKTELMGNEVVK